MGAAGGLERTRTSRRQVLAALTASGAFAAAPRWLRGLGAASENDPDTNPPGRQMLAALPFLDEARSWRSLAPSGEEDLRYGSGLGGRQLFDLETLGPRDLVVPSERFFVRTFRPEGLGDAAEWSIAVGGLAAKPRTIRFEELRRRSRPRGVHLVECSGNSAQHSFELISAAEWTGAPALELLERARPRRQATAVEVIGYDRHSTPSITSRPGASWIFTADQLAASGAFFATGMNGGGLGPDHGHPVRLVVPGWYGCCSIKWVHAARWLAADAPSSSQMREFAQRTHQDGVPGLASEFAPATVDAAAMPIRAELWRSAEGLELRVVGLLWGGSKPVHRLSIQAGADGGWETVQRLDRGSSPTTWRLWYHRWQRPPTGRMASRLRVDDPQTRTRRLDRGHYTRTVDVRI
jgi:DMSO/TMAO reductase YedYZ molybdopterin-dependent catalytic subunit